MVGMRLVRRVLGVSVVVAVAGASAMGGTPPAAAVDPVVVVLTAPADGATVRGVVPLSATTTGTVARVDFRVSADGGATWAPISSDVVAGDGWTASWDTQGLDGPVLVEARVDALTAVAHEVTVEDVGPSVVLAPNRTRFSPNGDGVTDKVTARVDLVEAVTLTVTVRRNGAVVRTLAAGRAAGPGRVTFEWNGRNAAGRRVADDTYSVRADATDVIGNATTRSTAVTVDTTPPRFVWLGVTPDPLMSAGPLTLRFRLRGEVRPVTLRFGVQDRFGVVDTVGGVQRPVGDRQLGWRPAYRNGTPLYPGLHLLQAVVRDDVGNQASSPLRRLRVHRPVVNRIMKALPAAGRRVAITIDDCNDGASWSRMLGILRARQVHASFFCIGANVARFPDLARRTVADGHTVGSHTPDHVQVDTISEAEVASRLRRDQATWWNVAHTTPSPFWRPPYGGRSSSAEAAAGRTGFRWTMLWSIDPQDWERPGSDAIVAHVLGRAAPGAVILLHALPGTADALDRIISGLRARGLTPVSLAELVHAAGQDRS